MVKTNVCAVKIVHTIRYLLVGMFHLMWSPVTREEEVEQHDMTLNERALMALVTVLVIAICFALL